MIIDPLDPLKVSNKITTPNFLELLKDLKDSRREQGKMHSLEMIIAILITIKNEVKWYVTAWLSMLCLFKMIPFGYISLMSIISGNTSICSMGIFAQRHKKDLFDLFNEG